MEETRLQFAVYKNSYVIDLGMKSTQSQTGTSSMTFFSKLDGDRISVFGGDSKKPR